MRALALALLVFSVTARVAPAADGSLPWPQFRGPDGSGVAEDERPPVEIGPAKNVKWKVAVPSGFSSPIVAGDLLVLTAFDDGKLFTIAYRRADGSEAWRAQAPADQIEPYHKTEGSPASSTPVTDGTRIVSYFGSSGLFCYDLAGKLLWDRRLPTVATPGDFGSGVSPILADGKVVLVRDELKQPKIMAIDMATGSVAWEKPRQSISGYATPVAWRQSGRVQVAAPGNGKMIGYDLQTGEEVWSVTGMPAACCASPTVAGDTLYFAAWSPGDPSDEEGQMPSFDDILKQGDANGDGILDREEADKTPMKDFFASLDSNKDGKYTREESEALKKFLSTSRNSAFALRAGGTGELSDRLLWKKTTRLPYVPSAIFYKGQYILLKDGGIVTIYDAATGKSLSQGRTVHAGQYYASPVAAGGNVYFTSLHEGVVTVLKPGDGKPEVVAQNPPLGERVAATPAVADDTLYIRTAGRLYAFAKPQ
jgi:outer membrane protein assembly factor BamB